MAQQTDISKMETTQTAVEYAISQILLQMKINPIAVTELFICRVGHEAEEIFKEQIKDAYWNGTTDTEKQDALIEAEHFYNEYYYKPQ
jgi:hypothetical protein